MGNSRRTLVPSPFWYSARIVNSEFLRFSLSLPTISITKKLTFDPGGRCLIPFLKGPRRDNHSPGRFSKSGSTWRRMLCADPAPTLAISLLIQFSASRLGTAAIDRSGSVCLSRIRRVSATSVFVKTAYITVAAATKSVNTTVYAPLLAFRCFRIASNDWSISGHSSLLIRAPILRSSKEVQLHHRHFANVAYSSAWAAVGPGNRSRHSA